MSSGYLYAFLALSCFMVLGLLHKLADRRNCRPTQINCLLFGWSTILSLGSLLWQAQPVMPPLDVWKIALPSGACAATAILLFQIGVRHGSIATSWLIVNLSAAIPAVLSVILYGEHVSWRKALALVAMLASLILLWFEKRNQEALPAGEVR